MYNFKEPKAIENFMHNIEQLFNTKNQFVNDHLKETVLLYRELEKQEKMINDVIVQKRQDFKEALRYIPLSVQSSLRIFIKTQIVEENDGKKIVVDLLGKHVLNEQFNNSFLEKESQEEKMFGFEKFPNLIKRIELVPTVDNFFEVPVQINQKMINQIRKKESFQDKKGIRLQGKIQNIFTSYSSDFVLRLWLKKQATIFKLPENLQNFMNKKIASRREILTFIWSYIKQNNLLRKGIVTLDEQLKKIFSSDSEQEDINFIPVNEIGSQLKQYCQHEEKLEFKIELGSEEQVTDCYEILHKLPLDETRECMAFFAEKMNYDEKSLQHAKKKNMNNFNLKYIEKEVTLKNQQEEILKNFDKVKRYLLKRQNYANFATDMEKYLIDFLDIQNQNLKSIRSHSANFIQKKNYADPNDFMNHLLENYNDLIEREIKRILKPC